MGEEERSDFFSSIPSSTYRLTINPFILLTLCYFGGEGKRGGIHKWERRSESRAADCELSVACGMLRNFFNRKLVIQLKHREKIAQTKI